ncbi:hypothetical protein [Sphingopyxis sp. 550A]
MTNATKGETPLRLPDGREYILVLDFEALPAAERLYGAPIAQVTVDAGVGFVGALRAMLYGALRRHHPDITPEEAGQIFATDGRAAQRALEEASKAAYPDPTEGEKSGNVQAGKNSGRNGANQGSTRKGSGGKPRARSR